MCGICGFYKTRKEYSIINDKFIYTMNGGVKSYRKFDERILVKAFFISKEVERCA